MDVMMGIAREDFFSQNLLVLNHVKRRRKLTHQPGECVNQKLHFYELKRNDEKTVT